MALSIIGFGFNAGGGGGGGTPGPPGTPGSVWRNGSGIPSNGLGINGDYYLNNDNGFVYQKTSGAYTQIATIKGADGLPGADGANSTQYSFDDGGVAPPPSNTFTANNDDLELLTEIYVNNLNKDGINFYTWWEFLLNWYTDKSPQNNFIQIREVGTTLVIGTYLLDSIVDNTTYFTLSLIPIGESQGILVPTESYVLSYATGGADGAQGDQGVNAVNSNIYFIDNLTTPPPSERFNQTPEGLASLTTNFDIAVNNIYGDQTSWLNGAKLLSDAGSVGYLSVSPTSLPYGQAIFTIDSITDNTTYFTFNVTFYGGNDLDFAAYSYPNLFAFSYIFNGLAGGVTPAALSKDNDTNVTLTLGGTPSAALLQAVSITAGWTGTLADSRIASSAVWNAKQAALVSTTNIKSINGTTILGSGNFATPFELVVAASDESTALTAGTAKITFRMPRAVTLTSVRASLTTAQASGSVFTVDINESGTSILSTKLTIDNTEKTSTTAVTPAVISDVNLADDAEITINIDQIGNGTATGLKVSLIGVFA